MITVYGIPNCDKCRAAIRWFKNQGLEFRFHDLRADGLSQATLEHWQAIAGDETLINKRSKTWRAIPATERETTSSMTLQKLMLDNPTLVKRPVVDNGKAILVGYDEAVWTDRLLSRN